MMILVTRNSIVAEKHKYQNGFGSYHESEAIEGNLPASVHYSPQSPHTIHAQTLLGTSFNASWCTNQQPWILAAAGHSFFQRQQSSVYHIKLNPNKRQWSHFNLDGSMDWVHSLHLVPGASDPVMKHGLGTDIIAAGKSIDPYPAFYSADGDFITVPDHGFFGFWAEPGFLLIRPNEKCVASRNLRYRVFSAHGPVCGCILERHHNHFQLPKLGYVGSKCLGNTLYLQDEDFSGSITQAFCSKTNSHSSAASLNQTPFVDIPRYDWCNLYKYDLTRFQTTHPTSYAHPDSVIFTLSSHLFDNPSAVVSGLIKSFLRWPVSKNTFQSSWYHWNTLSGFIKTIIGSDNVKCYKW